VLRNLSTDSTPYNAVRGPSIYDKCGTGVTPSGGTPGGGNLFSGETWHRTNPWYAAAASAAAPGTQSRVGTGATIPASASHATANTTFHAPSSTSGCAAPNTVSQKGKFRMLFDAFRFHFIYSLSSCVFEFPSHFYLCRLTRNMNNYIPDSALASPSGRKLFMDVSVYTLRQLCFANTSSTTS
jgi:hypothetical protein